MDFGSDLSLLKKKMSKLKHFKFKSKTNRKIQSPNLNKSNYKAKLQIIRNSQSKINHKSIYKTITKLLIW